VTFSEFRKGDRKKPGEVVEAMADQWFWRKPDTVGVTLPTTRENRNLRARYAIHTVGPIKGRSGEHDAELLAACYKNSLALAVQHGLRNVAFPSISTGAFGYPREEAAAVSSETIRDFLRVESLLEEVRLVFYTRGDVNVFLRNHRFGEENEQAGTPPD
jgi:O-acetyl-ADP-ribose deacetylase (regulator of RNase III)